MKDVNILTNNGVDVDHGIELLGDMETYNSILCDFLNDFVDRMNKIETAKNNIDMALKSDSKYLGFMRLADISYQHEMASKENDLKVVTENYQAFIMEANRIYKIGIEYMNSNLNISNTNVLESSLKGRKAIIVADDSSIVRNFVKDVFHEEYEVLEASNGQEVINLIASNSNSIVALLLDLNMPEVDGFAVLDYFKENKLFTVIPVSIISGADDKESIDRAFTYPIADMLNKPFNRDNVKLTIEKTIHFGNN